MKKWLVGLMAAGLCAASAWAETNTVAYFVQNKAVTVMQGQAPEGSSAIYSQTYTGNSGQAIGGTSITLTLKGYEGTTVTGLRLAMHSNSKAGAGSLSATCGDAVIGSIADAPFNDQNWYGAWSQIFVDVTVPVTPTVIDDDIFITIAASSNSLYCEEFHIDYIPVVPKFFVSLDPGADFTVVLDTPTDIRAIAENATGSVEYAWTLDGEPSDVLGDTFTVDTSVADGSHEVVCVATDTGSGATSEASVSYTVVGAYTVTVADGIENGSVAVWDGETELASSADVLEGTVLTVVATPATRSYKVQSVSVTGETSGDAIALTDGEFEMPAEDVLVTATFVKREGTAYALVESMDGFEAGADYLIVAHKDGSYSSALKSAYQSESDGRIAVEEVEIDGDTVETDDASIVWRIDAGADEGQYTIYNATAGKFVSAPAASNLNAALLVDAGTNNAAQWTLRIDTNSQATIGSIYEGKSLQRNDKVGNAYFANYKGGTKPSLFKKVGAGVFSISLEPSGDDVVFTAGEGGVITAMPKNAQGAVTYTWNWTEEGPGSASEDGSQWVIPADAPTGSWTLYCSAKDEVGNEADASVSFSIVAAPVIYEVTVDEGIENGDVSVDPASGVAGTVIAVTAIPHEGYRCDGIYVNGDPIDGLTFELPEGGATVGAVFVESNTKTATYTVVSKTEVETTGEAPAGSAATFECNGYSETQLTGGTHMILTLKGYEGATITGLTLSMKSNARAGAGSLDATCGDAVIAAIADARFNTESWYGSWSQNYVPITPAVTPTVVDGDVVITIAASANSLFCESFTIEYEPAAPVFSVGFDKEDGFTVPLGEASRITATAQNGVEPYAYAWSSETPELNGSGLVLEIPGTLEPGVYAVTVTATDSSDEPQTATADISFEVLGPPADYTVTVAGGIENGTVGLSVDGELLVTPAELQEGTEVTVVATPDDGFELEAVLVNGEPIEGDTFTVAGDSEVSATFAEVVDYATLPFLAENTPFTGPWQTPKEAGVTAEGLGTDYNNTTDGRGAKFDTTGDWLQIKFEGTPGELSYGLKGNGTSPEQVSTFDVAESATGEDGTWTPVASHKSGENLFNNVKTNFTAELKADSRFVKFAYTERVAGNVGLFDVYISSGGFSVGFVGKEDGFEVVQGTADSIAAEAKNGVGEVTYAWTGDLTGEGAELAIPDTLGLGEYSVTVTATDSSEPPQTDSATITFTVVEAPPPPAMFTVDVADGILNGTIALFVDGEELAVPAEVAEGTVVTVVATPYDGYKAGEISVNITNVLESDSFTVTEDATVYASFVESHDVRYVPVESADEFVAGEEYLIVAHKAGTFTDAMKNAADDKGTHIGVAGVSMDADGSVSTDNADIVWKIQAAKEEGQYVLFNEAGNVYAAATKNDNLAQLLAEGTNALAQWTLDLTGLPSVKIVSVSYTNRWLQRNTTSNLQFFATYTGTQTTPLLYKKAGPTVFDVTVNKTGFEVPLGSADAVTASAKNGVEPYSYVWTSETEELNGAGALLEIPATLAAGEYTATVTATDSSEPPQTDTAEVTFTVAAPAVKYAVTVDQEIANGTIAADKDEAEAGETVTLTATPADGWKLGTFTLNGVPFAGDSFEMPEGGALVSAEFVQIVKYPITVDGEIANGSIAADKDEAEAGEIVTLTATPDDGWKLGTFILNGDPIGGNTFEMPEGEALVSAEFVERTMTTYELLEDADDFVAGEEYLIVAHKADGFTSAMKNEASGDRIGLEEVDFKTETTIETDNDAIVWVIKAGAEGQYTLYNAAAGVYAAAKSDGNFAKITADPEDALAQWTLDLTALPEAKIVSASYTNRWLQRNSTANNKYFATYTGSQTTPSLYKKAGFSVGFVDKEDEFTVDEGTADSITAEAVRGVEPYSYVWTSETPALNGTGETLVIPDTLGAAETPYSVTVTATDSSEPPQTASKTITFEVVPPTVRFEVTVAEGIVGGTVTVDKALAEPGETVTVTATPADGYELVDIRVDGEPIGGDTFEMPSRDVEVSATFREIVDYVTLPFVAEDTPYRGPWQNPAVAGLTHNGLGSDYGDGAAKFRTAGVWMQIKFDGTPGSLTYGIKGNGLTEESGITFRVQESADGETWADLAVYTSDGNLDDDRKDEKAGVSEDSRFVRFFLETKTGEGNVGIYDVYISEAGAAEPLVTVAGETTVRLGDTFELALALENYAGGAYTWTNNVLFGTIDAGTATFWWTPPRTGEFPVTFSAMDGNRTIASATVTLAVLGEPALVFDGDGEGTVGTPVAFTVVAENVADPAVTFMGFLDVPEGSALTAADVTVDFPNVSFTPDVAGEYGLAFCAGTTGVDYVEDAWIVTVAAAPLEPAVALVDGETTVELGDYFLLQFALENYTGEFTWTADVGDIDGDGYFTWTPGEAGEFPVVVSAVAGEETIASTTVTLTVTGETPPPVSQPEITKVEIDVAAGVVTLEFSGTGVEVWGTDDLMGITDQWAPLEAAIEGDTAIVEMNKHFLRIQ